MEQDSDTQTENDEPSYNESMKVKGSFPNLSAGTDGMTNVVNTQEMTTKVRFNLVPEQVDLTCVSTSAFILKMQNL